MLSDIVIIPAGIFLLLAGALACLRWGVNALYVLVPLGAGILYFASPSHSALSYLATALSVGPVAGLAFHYGKSVQFVFLYATILSTAIGTGHYYYTTIVKGKDIVSEWKQSYTLIVESTGRQNNTAERISADDIYSPTVVKMVPFLYFLNSLFMTVLGLALLRPLLSRIKKYARKLTGMEMFRLHEYFIFALIGSIAAAALFYNKKNVLSNVSINSLLIILFLYLLQGFGVIRFYAVTKKISIFVVLTLIAVSFLLGGATAFVLLLIMVAVLGTLDFWVDFRSKIKAKKISTGDDKEI